MNERNAHWESGVLEPEDIDDRMSAIRNAIESGGPEQGVLLLTDVIAEMDEGDAAPHEPEPGHPGHAATTTIAEVLLEADHLRPQEVAEILRAEFRHWLESDGRQVLAQLLDELIERDQQQQV